MGRRASSLAQASSIGDATPFGAPLGATLGEGQLRLLGTFAAVAAAGGLSPAAVELQLDLSTVSKQLRELEALLGVTLARRGRGGFQLTDDGLRLQALTRRLFGAMRAFGEDLAAFGGSAPPPVLRLGVVDALLTSGAVPSLLARCAQAVPGLQWQLATRRPQEIERELLAGTLDAGIVAARTAPAGLEQHLLYAEANNLWVAPGHPWYAQAADENAALDFAEAALVTDPYLYTLPAALLPMVQAPVGAARADSLEAVALLVATGRHAGFLPDHYVEGVAALGSLRRVQPARHAHRQDIVLSCRRGKASPALRRLIRAVAAGPDGASARGGRDLREGGDRG